MGYPFLLMDALPLKVREEGRIRCRGVMIATGTNTKGYREGLGLMLGDNESKPAGASSFAGLKAVTCVVWNW